MSAEIIQLEQQIDPLVQANNHYKMMVDFVKQQMKKGVDFGIVPGTNNKPVLLKPGAEKLCRLFNLYPQLELVESITDFDKPLFHYHYRCTIYRHGEPIGQGEGCCNSKEKKYEKQQYKVYDLVNTICKISQKRALISAVLVAVGASEFFAQDLDPTEESDSPLHLSPTSTGNKNKPRPNSQLIDQTTEELKRLGWSNQQGQAYLKKYFNVTTRAQLTPMQLQQFLELLRSL